jgi:hypothetical protein
MSTITLQTYAVAVLSPSGYPLVVGKCHNRATAEVIKARAEREAREARERMDRTERQDETP